MTSIYGPPPNPVEKYALLINGSSASVDIQAVDKIIDRLVSLDRDYDIYVVSTAYPKT